MVGDANKCIEQIAGSMRFFKKYMSVPKEGALLTASFLDSTTAHTDVMLVSGICRVC